MNHADYRYPGFPTGLAAGLDALATNGLLRGLSLPAFLIEAYISDHLTRTSCDQDPIENGKLIAAAGAVCGVGGVIGETTEDDPLEILSLTLDVSILPVSVEEFWYQASRSAKEMLETYSTVFEIAPPSLLPFHVAVAYRNSGTDYPNDIDAIKCEHDRQIDFRKERGNITAYANPAFTTGIALARNHIRSFQRIHGVHRDERLDPDTMTFKHAQSETNFAVGSRFSYQHVQRICLIWANHCRPEAKPYFVEPTNR